MRPLTAADWYRRATARAEEAGHAWPDLFARQMQVESGFGDDVIYCRRVSSAGAEGIAQIMRIYHPGVDPCDPEAALAYAARLMVSYYQRYGRWDFALAAYNAGAGNVDRYGGVPPFEETQRYVSLLLGDGQQPPGSGNGNGGGSDILPKENNSGAAVLIGAAAILFVLGVI